MNPGGNMPGGLASSELSVVILVLGQGSLGLFQEVSD